MRYLTERIASSSTDLKGVPSPILEPCSIAVRLATIAFNNAYCLPHGTTTISAR